MQILKKEKEIRCKINLHAIRRAETNALQWDREIDSVLCIFCKYSSSIEKVSKIPSPVLIIHGTEDEVIDFSHGLALFERCPKAVEPLWVEGAGHNDIELYSQYLERLRRFINQDLAAQHAWETHSLSVFVWMRLCVCICEYVGGWVDIGMFA